MNLSGGGGWEVFVVETFVKKELIDITQTRNFTSSEASRSTCVTNKPDDVDNIFVPFHEFVPGSKKRTPQVTAHLH